MGQTTGKRQVALYVGAMGVVLLVAGIVVGVLVTPYGFILAGSSLVDFVIARRMLADAESEEGSPAAPLG